MKKKPWLYGCAGVLVALVILYVAVLSPSPSNNDLAGAIGAAKHYRADQITAADVALQDPEIQDLLQSDFFYKLATDNEFRKMAVDQLARLDLVSGRCAQFTSVASLGNMRMFLDLALGNADLRNALAAGRMDIVRTVLDSEKRLDLLDVANRIYLVEGRHPQINRPVLQEMRMFLDMALGNADLRQALAAGKMDLVQSILASNRQADLALAAQKVFVAESRQPQLHLSCLADMKVFLDLALGNADLKAALISGRMDRINEVLDRENRLELIDVANRIHLLQGRHAQIDAASLADMRMFLDQALSNQDLKQALAAGRMDMVNEILVKDGRADLQEAAQKVFLSDRRQAHLAEAGLSDLRMFLDLATSHADLKAAMAEGRMNIVREILDGSNRLDLLDVANRLYLAQGRHPQINLAAYADMRMFLDLALSNQDLKMALAEGRMDRVDAALIQDGKMEMCLAANRVYLTQNRHQQLDSVANLGNMRAIVDFAGENAEFRQAIQDNQLDAAARIALHADKPDIALRHLQMASYVLGDHRHFVPDLHRVVVIADSPAYKLAVADPGWGRLVASADAAVWKQTVDSVKDGRMTAQRP